MRQTPPSRSDRSKLRVQQILDAAKHCFSRVGFHSTSMAQIAAQAQISVGQIYRHFPSKESLIEGIVQEDIARQLSIMNATPDTDVVDALTAMTQNKAISSAVSNPKHLALMLEIVAEAARNPKVRDIVISNQRRGFTALKKRIESAQPGVWPPGELDVRLRLVSAIVQGVVGQMLLDRRAPTAALLAWVQTLAAQLLVIKPSIGNAGAEPAVPASQGSNS
jgi:AcrR family transcriptional regulator